ncbi:Uroporphyrin-III C/tetrapyrrole (Corrin/Porphyrin) methyltransferase [Desulfosarcina cetonica]|uniref:SAM-dependent methyltransferase n=1 Tax=Desulfosarcina cetonica TaxID=90730 RepID=UPI0006D080EB|nr:SAM-dependent methyltransferase [Desulfosarcina cetonica]VTR64356.1 Uroporphyrin-III C/tetrapyrrole (Corrin/Porphyrin) methyltransferase [Desulfosarcina cetonica]
MHDKKTKYRIWTGGLLLALAWIFVIGCATHPPLTENSQAKTPGSYTVVGIGPGDGDLLTVRAAEAIRNADVVFCNPKTRQKLAAYIDFSDKRVVDGYGVLFRYYGRDCKKISQGEKRPGEPMRCEEYHRKQAEFATMVRDAVSAGKHVVLLSGGDPTIYGPDMWTVKELKDLAPTVIPGLSAFNAANAALKVSLGEVILTAPFKKEGSRDTIEQLAGHERATMVIFMPRDMQALFARLSQSYPAQTPAAIVSNAGVVGQEKVTMGTVGGFSADTSGIDRWRSIVYVGEALSRAAVNPDLSSQPTGQGKFYLVGVGPGDPDLITLRGLKVIESADLVFAHQRLKDKFQDVLSGKEVLTGYHRLFPFYGKPCAKGQPAEQRREQMSCEEYHQKQEEFAALVRAAVADGKTVAMLDSGDPLVYGPCSWSLTELRDLDTEVVPGLSCFNAANAALKAGVTEGKSSHSVILASGWSVADMAVHQSTMVLFTMRTQFQKFIDGLSAHYAPDTPVAIVFSAGYAEKERVLQGSLGTILEQVGTGRMPFEYLLYVGDFLADGGRVAQ